MASIPQWTVSEPYVDIPGTLLEGPYYDAARNEFRFVDIWEQKLYVLDLAKGPESLKTLDTSASIGCVSPPHPPGRRPARLPAAYPKLISWTVPQSDR
jgi:sugar lactone lactonase YvrE